MTTRRFLVLLCSSMIAIIGAMYLSSLRHLDRDPRGGSLLPGLDAQLDAVTDIRLRKGGPAPAVSLHRSAPGHWTVKERGDYPADVSKIRKLLLAVADAKIVEEKTSNPANYAILGVEDPGQPTAAGVELTLGLGGAGRSLIVGKPAATGTFVRRGGEATSYSVEPAITVEPGPRDWIDTALPGIAAEKIQSVKVHLADGTNYAISRKAPTGPSTSGPSVPGASTPGAFSLEAAPPGREAADAATLAPSPASFSGISIDDVSAAADVDFSKASTCELKSFDGSLLIVTGAAAADKHWIKVAASNDAALNARAHDRAFEIAGYRYDAMFRPIEQLLKPKPVKPQPSGSRKKPAATR